MLSWLFAMGLVATSGFVGMRWLRRGAKRAALARVEAFHAAAAFAETRSNLTVELQRSTTNGRPLLKPLPPLLARDAATGELIALAPAQADDAAEATAVFAWRRERWQTDGRIIVGQPPSEAYRRNRSRLIAA